MEEQRSVIHFLWSEGVKPSEIYRRMKVQYGDSCLNQGRVYEWMERFQNENGRQNVSDEHWSGRPVSMATETVKQQIEQQIHDYRQITIDEIALEFNMSHDSAYSIVHDDLGYRKCVADGSQGSCPVITSMHSRQFVRSIWTSMLVKKMLFPVEL
jgi:hypothetical protein